jgi:hypothetical protein
MNAPERNSAVWREVTVKCSRQPFFDAARRLLADGHAADEVLMMVHSNRTQKLKLTLGATARLRR